MQWLHWSGCWSAHEPTDRPDEMKTWPCRPEGVPPLARTLSLTLLVLLVLAGCRTDSERQTAEASGERRTPLLLVSIDGFMSDYMDRHPTPHLDRLVREGVFAESMLPVFPTKTFPTHYSMVTGLYVENHGIISNRFYNIELDEQFSFGPPEESADQTGWWGGEPIWVTAEKQGLTAATLFWPGSDYEIGGVRPTRYLDYDAAMPNAARVDSIIAWMDPEGPVQADFGTLYYSDVDVSGHRFGPRSSEVAAQVAAADEWIGYLVRRLEEVGLWGGLNLIVVSDHGMAELSHDRLIFLDDLIDLERVRVVDRTPVALIQPSEGERERIYQQLREQEENYRVFLKEELPEAYRFTNHGRIPDIVLIADTGYFITTHDTYESAGIPMGMHGYDHRDPEMHAFFLAAGPDFRSGDTLPSFESIHLYEVMSRLLGIDPAPNDGDLDAVRFILD